MAINFLQQVDFNKIQMAGVTIENYATDVLAGTGVSGELYWNTTQEELRGWDGTANAWVAIGSDTDVLTFAGGVGGNQTVQLKNQTFSVAGTTNQIVTTGSAQTITLSFPTGGVTLPNGSVATTQTSGDNSTKVATTAFVAAAVGGQDTLAEILTVGNTTGGTDIAVSAGDDITFTSTSAIVDAGGSKGTNGQYLVSTGATIDWITLPTLDNYDKWKLTGTGGGELEVISGADITISGDGVTAITGGSNQALTLALANTDKGSAQTFFKTFNMSGTNSSGSIAATANNDTGTLAGTANQINIVGGTKTATWSLAGGSTTGTRLNLTGTPTAPTPASGDDSTRIATTAFVQAAVTGLLEFKGGFNANTGAIVGGGNLTTGGSRVAIAVGDYYVVTVAGNFFGNAATPLTPGDSVIVQTAAAAGASVEGDFIIVQSDTDLATYSTVGLGNVNVENDTGIAAGYHGSSGGAATGGVLNINYTSGTADIALRGSTATALGIVSIVEGDGIDVTYSNGAATIAQDIANNPATKLVDLNSSLGAVTRTFANGITTYDLEVDNSGVFGSGVLSANVLAEVQVKDASIFTGASVGMTVYAEVTRTVSDAIKFTFAGNSADNSYKVWLTRMA